MIKANCNFNSLSLLVDLHPSTFHPRQVFASVVLPHLHCIPAPLNFVRDCLFAKLHHLLFAANLSVGLRLQSIRRHGLYHIPKVEDRGQATSTAPRGPRVMAAKIILLTQLLVIYPTRPGFGNAKPGQHYTSRRSVGLARSGAVRLLSARHTSQSPISICEF